MSNERVRSKEVKLVEREKGDVRKEKREKEDREEQSDIPLGKCYR